MNIMKRLLCLTLVVLLGARPAPRMTSATDSAARTIDTRLSNGLHVVIVPDGLAPVVTAVISYAAGSDQETKPGEAHAVEHMMFRGTRSISANLLADIGARMGAQYDANTSNEFTNYYFTAPARYLNVILHIEADRMRNATISEKDWDLERGAIEQEVRADESNPSFGLEQKVREALYAGTPFTRDALGTVESFNAMQAPDLRSFYNAWYHPNNATLVIAGGVDPAAALREVRTEFGKIPSARLPSRVPGALKPLKTQTIDATLDVPVGSVGFAFRFPGLRSPDYAAGQILISALDDPRGALADLAASGRVLGAFASASTTAEFSVASVSAGVRPGTDTAAALAALQQSLEQIVARGVPADAIASAKRRILDARAFDLTSIPGTAFGWVNALSLGLHGPEVLRNAYSRVSVADVDRVLRAYLGTSERLTVRVTPGGLPGRRGTRTGGGENVVNTNPKPEPLPAWAAASFHRPLAPLHEPANTKTCVLPNGISLIATRSRLAPVVEMIGSIENNQTLYAPAGRQGVAEVTNALMSWGTTTLDRKAFAAAVEAIPATIRGGTSFGLSVPTRDFDRALALLADNMLHPRFPKDGFTLIQRNYRSILEAQQSRPPWKALLAMDSGLYPYGDPVRRHPTPAFVRALTLADVHAWYEKAFRPDETRIAVVGDIDPAFVCREIAKHFGGWKNDGPKPMFGYPMIPLNGQLSATIPSPTIAQTYVQLGEIIPIHLFNPDTYALELADTILTGEGTASRLVEDLRTRHGYVYSVNSNLDIGHQRSTYTFSFAADPKNVGAAEEALLADLRRLQTTDVSNADLAQAKATWLASSELARDSYGGLADDLLGSVWFPGNAKRNVGIDWKAVLNVTPVQVREAMAKWVRPGDFVRVSIVPQTAP